MTVKKNIPPEHINKDGSPDMRVKENRDDPSKIKEANERHPQDALPGDGRNKDGTPDLRLKENRDNIIPNQSQK